ncbi:MAG: diguanylate cyclase [Candidatus Zixiibacteriota bacterium]
MKARLNPILWSRGLTVFLLSRCLLFLGICLWLAFAPTDFQRKDGWVLLGIFVAHLCVFHFFSRKVKSKAIFSFTFLFDIAFITALIYFTGRIESQFFLLYYVIVSIGAFYLGLNEGLLLAFFSSFLYLLVNLDVLETIFVGDLLVRLILLWPFAFAMGVISVFVKSSEQKLIQTLDRLNERTSDLERTQVQIETIYEASRTLGEIHDLDQVLDEILNITRNVLNLEFCSILLYDKGNNCLWLMAKAELGKKFKYGVPQKVSLNGIFGLVAQRGKSERIMDLRNDPRHIPVMAGEKSELAVSMISRGKVIGVLDARSRKLGDFAQQDQKVLSVLAASAAMAIENAMLHQRMEELTVVDELTGIYNYRYFAQKLENELKRAKRYHQKLSLIMIDIDSFKKCNDSYGHLFGNLVLKKLVDVIKGCVRDVDIFARYGGEEFVIILPQTTKSQAKMIGERIRICVESTNFKDEKDLHSAHLTVSLGVSCYPESGETTEELIKKVDQALYLAKGEGKNLVRTA